MYYQQNKTKEEYTHVAQGNGKKCKPGIKRSLPLQVLSRGQLFSVGRRI